MDLLANYSDESSKQSPNPVVPTINKMDSKLKAKSLEEEWASFEKLIDGEKMSDTAEKNEAGTSDGNVLKRKFSEGASGTSESYAFEIQSSSSSCSSSRSNSVEPVSEKLPESKHTGDKESASHLPSQFRSRKDSGRGSSTSRSRSRSLSPRRSKKSKDKRSRSHSRDKRSRSRDRHRDRKSHKKEKRRHRSSSRDRKSRSHSRKRSSSRHRSPHSKRSRSRSKDRKRTRDRKSSRDRHRHRSKDRSHRRRKHSSKSPRRRSSRSPRRRSSRSPRRRSSRSPRRNSRSPRRNSRSPRRHKSRSPRRRSSRSRSYSPRTFKNVPVDSYQKKLMGTLAKSSKPLTFREKMRQDLLKASKMLSDQADKGLLMDGKTSDTGKDKFRNLSSSSSTEGSNVTPQMALLQTMAAMHQKAQEMTGVTVPKYYNPAAVNPLKYAEQFQKRKLLWSKNKEKKEEKGGEHWQGTAFQADNDGKISAKFRKLMGMKEDDPITDEALTEEQKIKREEIFNRLDKDYEFARMSTHTHRGVGLGFASQGMSIPQFPQP